MLKGQTAKLERAEREAEKQKKSSRRFQTIWRIWTVFLAVIAMLGIGNRISFAVMAFLLCLLLAAGAGLWFYEKRQTFTEDAGREDAEIMRVFGNGKKFFWKVSGRE